MRRSVTGPPICQVPIDQADPVPSANSLSFSKFNPAGTIAYQFTPDINTYLRIATGYKAGGSSEAANFGQFGQTFSPEDVTTYELGLKSYWFEHRLRANVAVFYSDFSNMQLQFNTVPGNLAIVQSYNAGKATVQGAEFEFLYAPTNDLTLGVSDTVLSTDMKTVYALPGTIFDPATNPYSPYQVGQNIAPLFRVPYAPNNVLVSTLDWTMFRRPRRRQSRAVPRLPLSGSSVRHGARPASTSRARASTTPSRRTGCSTGGSPGMSTPTAARAV